jgi:thiamine biosynthesis lipoprotein
MIPVGPEFVIASEITPGMHQLSIAIGERTAFAFHDASVLGTRLNLLTNTDSAPEALAAAHRARAEIDRLNLILNWRDPTSELARLNRSNRHVASDDLFAVIAAAEYWRDATGDAYSGRLGRVLELWRMAQNSLPHAAEVERLATAARTACLEIDLETRAIIRPDAVRFDLDGLAKGYIVDRALEAAMASSAISGALLDIGGDIRCAGEAPGGSNWLVGLPYPLIPYDNAPLVGGMALRDRAIATSGCGPRDRLVGKERRSATLDPYTGWPVPHRRSATAITSSALDADALATALLNLTPAAGAELVKSFPGASARLARPDEADWLLGGVGRSVNPPPEWITIQSRSAGSSQPEGPKWHDRWVAFVSFTAPPRQMKRDIAFRSPYVAIWISDIDNRPVRTLVLIGSIKEWQHDNYIWWGQNRAIAQKLVDSRSMSTRGTGIYKLLWDGIDESGKSVPPGRYVVHVETSRERGKHTHRSLELDFSEAKRVTAELPNSEESGGLVVAFERY